MPLYALLPAVSQTLFANVEQAGQAAQIRRTIADLPGGIVTKTIKGRTYLYYQTKRPDGAPRQIYLGPADAQTLGMVEEANDLDHRKSLENLAAMTRAAIAAGGTPVSVPHARVIRRLADHGFFAAGGILVGTHAFLAYQNVLGLRWTEAHATSDIDFAHPGRNISIALAQDFSIDTGSAIASLQMGFIPNADGTTFTKADETDFELDFLTSRGRHGDAPQRIDGLNISLQPLRFMEYSMEDPLESTLLSRAGPIAVKLPQPARYGLHKLLVAPMRGQRFRTKANKDLRQSAALMDYFRDNEPDTLARALRDLVGRGPTWRRSLFEGSEALAAHFPEQAAFVRSIDREPAAARRK